MRLKRILTGLIAGILLVSIQVQSTALQGVDVYHGTWHVDYAKLKQSGHGDFVYIKATEGEHTPDTSYSENVSGARSVTMPYGAYHFFHPYSASSAKLQADFFWNTIKSSGFQLIPAVDVEITDSQDAPAIQADLRAFITEFQKLSGYKPMIYTYTSFAKSFLGSGFGDCKLWIAHYGVSRPASTPSWGSSYSIWQYSSDGQVSGIYNPADLDIATDSGIFLGAGEPSTPVSSPVVNKDVYPVMKMPFPWNSTAGARFNVFDSRGALAAGRYVSQNDRILIYGVDYDRQLAEVYYPTAGGFMHGYIQNFQSFLHNRYYNGWQNGRTNETVFSNSYGTAKTGTVFPYENATLLFRKGSRSFVLYGTKKGPETKTGWVNYPGSH